MIHSLDTDIACKVGVNAALIYEAIKWWCAKHKVDGTNHYDGNWWVFNSRRAWCELFPYLSEQNIKTAINKLVNAGLILKGNYNTEKFCRTNWYAIADKTSLVASNQSLVKINQRIGENQPINTITSTNITSTSIESKKNSACAHTREGVVADIIENNRAWVENQIKAGIEPDDIGQLLGYAYDHLVNTGDEPNSKAVMRCAFFKLRDFKEHKRREAIRARDIEERKRELWKKLLPFIGKEFPKPMIVEFYKFCINQNDGIMYFEQWPEYDIEASLRQHKVKYEQRNQRPAL